MLRIFVTASQWMSCTEAMTSNIEWQLSYRALMMTVCISEIGFCWFRYWLVACFMPHHYLKQDCFIFNWTPRHNLHWNLSHSTIIFLQENAFKEILFKMLPILPRPQCVKKIRMIHPTHTKVKVPLIELSRLLEAGLGLGQAAVLTIIILIMKTISSQICLLLN